MIHRMLDKTFKISLMKTEKGEEDLGLIPEEHHMLEERGVICDHSII
jgi:hypothetical protein